MFPTPAPRCNMEGRCFQTFNCNFWNFWNLQQSNWTIIGFDLLSVYPGTLWRDSKNTWKLATTNTSKQQLSMLSHKFDIFSLFFSRFRNIECFLWSFHLTEENIFNAKNSKCRHQKQTETAEPAEQSQAPPNFLKRIFHVITEIISSQKSNRINC